MGNSNSLVPKFKKIRRKHKGKKRSIAIPCSDEGSQNYFECLCVQNGVLGHVKACTSDCKRVRGEIILEQHFTYDDKMGKDYQHEKIRLSDRRNSQKESVHNTLQKLSYGLKAQMPRKYDVSIGSCQDLDESSNIRKNYKSINSEKKGSREEVEEINSICYLEIFDLDMISLHDSLDIDKERFIEHWQTTFSMDLISVENSVVSDDAYNNTVIEHDNCIMYSKADNTTLTGIVNNNGRYTLSHRCSFPCHSTWSGEDIEPRDARIAIAYETAKKDVLVSYAIHNNGKTGPEPFVESSLSVWDSEEDYVSSENSESISRIQPINTALDTNSCPDVNVIAADKCKNGDDDSSHGGYIQKHQHLLMRDSKYQPNKHVESTEPTTSCQMFKQLNEETSIHNHLNETQPDSIMQQLNSGNTKLEIQIHGSYMPFNFDISTTKPGLSSRESNIPFSGCSFNEKGIKTDTREMSRKQSIVGDKPGRIRSSSVQSHFNSIPVSELGIVERDLSFQQGTLVRLSSDDENFFKRTSGLRWIFQYGFVSQRSVLRLQQWLRHQLYPFTNIKEFWASLGSNSPPSLQECMSVEWMRYQSFQNYPISAHGSTSRLARDGFYYTGQGTQARCFSCGIAHSDWNGTDNPREVHQRLSPNCPFLNGREERYPNIPMSPDGNVDVGRADSDSIPLQSPPTASLSGSGTGQSLAERRSESSEGSGATKIIDEDSTIRQNLGSGETTLGVPSHSTEESGQSEADNRPKYPEHDSLPSRIATFTHGWPPYLDQTPKLMAEAGFFFTGNQDYTRCYHCGGGLRNWEPGDNPWIEHCRWYPMCPHVLRGKGQRFVHAVLKKQAELLANQRAESRMKTQYGSRSADPLETLAAITVLEMGYPRDTVRNTILTLRRQREPGAEINAQDVLDFIWKEEDTERRRQEEEASRPRHPGDPKPPVLPTLMERLSLHGSPAATQTAVLKSASVITSSLTTAAMTLTSDTVVTSSTIGAASITSMSTSASGTTQNLCASGQEQKQDEGNRNKTNVGGAGDERGGSNMKDGGSEANVKTDIPAQNHEISNQEQQRPVGAVGGQLEVPSAMPEAIEDEEFHSLDSEEMEKKDPGELEEENKRLKDQTTCKICMENPVRVIFIPCGHLVCCETCAPAFRKCPICRKKIQQSVKTFL
ncbi:hypothetical protein ACJMK2_028365 [Sinanodonta woodiana]|uniref:RING-type domain-containing protein n=1 Tax=Sinanodonta woodiana TaxID=1069815 RepID=A0ABD3XAT4_SINWO